MTFTITLESHQLSSLVDLGDGVELYTSIVRSLARFQCIYPIDIEVNTEYSVDVNPILPSAPLTGIGTLASGFSLTFSSSSASETMAAGSLINAVVTWELQRLSDVTFYFHNCQVKTGAVSINVIEDGCYSKQS